MKHPQAFGSVPWPGHLERSPRAPCPREADPGTRVFCFVQDPTLSRGNGAAGVKGELQRKCLHFSTTGLRKPGVYHDLGECCDFEGGCGC